VALQFGVLVNYEDFSNARRRRRTVPQRQHISFVTSNKRLAISLQPQRSQQARLVIVVDPFCKHKGSWKERCIVSAPKMALSVIWAVKSVLTFRTLPAGWYHHRHNHNCSLPTALVSPVTLISLSINGAVTCTQPISSNSEAPKTIFKHITGFYFLGQAIFEHIGRQHIKAETLFGSHTKDREEASGIQRVQQRLQTVVA
jgi:hypothetical protein